MPTIISSYVLQYANVSYSQIAASSADLVITEGAPLPRAGSSPALTDAQVKALVGQGRIVAGYVNVSVTATERAYWNPAWTSDGDDRSALTAAAPAWLVGQPTNSYGYITKFWDPAWQKIVIDQAVALVQRGYNGVFLDDVAQYYPLIGKVGVSSGELADRMMALVVAVKTAVAAINPNIFVVVNGDPYIVTNATHGAQGAEGRAFLNAIDAMVLENQDTTVANWALSYVAPDAVLLGLNTPETASSNPDLVANSLARGIVPYVAGDKDYHVLGPAIPLGTAGADVISGGVGPNSINGLAGDDVITGGGGDDTFDGGSGEDTAVYSAPFNLYAVTVAGSARKVADLRPNAPEGTDTLTGVEVLRFADQSMVIGPVSTGTAVKLAVSNVLRLEAGAAAGQAQIQAMTSAITAGATLADQTQALIVKADATTSVAAMAYEFFTGKVPSGAGFDYLVSPTGPNANNLNSAYYQSFNLENRYINFAVNLGKLGEGKDAFAAKYGALSLLDATREAYKTIFGAIPTDAKIHAIIDTRANYFAAYGGDGANGIGTKAAMVGWLLAEAEKADIGVMARSVNAWLSDLADGGAPFAINVLDPSKGYYDPSWIFGG